MGEDKGWVKEMGGGVLSSRAEWVGFEFARGMGGEGWVSGIGGWVGGWFAKVDNGLKPKGFIKTKSLG
jgi:hypothetical protein